MLRMTNDGLVPAPKDRENQVYEFMRMNINTTNNNDHKNNDIILIIIVVIISSHEIHQKKNI